MRSLSRRHRFIAMPDATPPDTAAAGTAQPGDMGQDTATPEPGVPEIQTPEPAPAELPSGDATVPEGVQVETPAQPEPAAVDATRTVIRSDEPAPRTAPAAKPTVPKK
mgnify:CR=1 FL=1